MLLCQIFMLIPEDCFEDGNFFTTIQGLRKFMESESVY
jgi:hypothetical protein